MSTERASHHRVSRPLVASRRRFLLLAVDAVIVVCAYGLALVLRFGGGVPGASLVWFAHWGVAVVAIHLLANAVARVYSRAWRYADQQDVVALAVATGCAMCGVAILALSAADPERDLPLSAVVFGSGAALSGMTTVRLFRLLRWRDRFGHLDRAAERVLIVGAGYAGQRLATDLANNPGWGYFPVGFVDDDATQLGLRLRGVLVRGRITDIPKLAAALRVDAIIVAIPSAPATVLRQIVSVAEGIADARLLIVPSLDRLLRGEQPVSALRAVQISDLMGREPVRLNPASFASSIGGRSVLVTGAAGSIGSELARQLAGLRPSRLLLLDINESDLFDLHQALERAYPRLDVRAIVASVTHRCRLEQIFSEHRPALVFHAAAYKHVPLMESHPQEAIFVNAVGTWNIVEVAAAHGVTRFVLVSTDKAVNPACVMGATKRLAELVVRAVAEGRGFSACSVRFGNVLGSRGSVVPTFERQIAAGGPVTVTHPEMRRYFMTIPEAAGLIIQAAGFGGAYATYMLDMGEEILITELARRMIRLHGLRVGKDIAITFTGMRPGEKLREDLTLPSERIRPTSHPRIRELADRQGGSPDSAVATVQRMAYEIADGNTDGALALLWKIIARTDATSHISADRDGSGQHQNGNDAERAMHAVVLPHSREVEADRGIGGQA